MVFLFGVPETFANVSDGAVDVDASVDALVKASTFCPCVWVSLYVRACMREWWYDWQGCCDIFSAIMIVFFPPHLINIDLDITAWRQPKMS